MTGLLDTQVAGLLAAAEAAGIPPVHSMPYTEARDFYLLTSRKLAGEAPAELKVTNLTLGTDVPLPARHYRPPGSQDECLPALIYFHGGGWCIGGLDSHDHVCRWLASHSGCAVISVDYRMGPEHKFPTAVEDAYAATQWIAGHASELGINASKLAVGGDSAGGNLSAVVSILAREQGTPAITCQLLVYPATDMLMRFPSHARCGDGYRLTRTSIAWFIAGYLRSGEDMYDFRASPLMAENHAGLPPAMILTAGFDPLKDEGEAYANKLKDAGVQVDYRCYDGMIHGFIAMPGAVDVAKTALLDAASYIRGQLQG